MQATDRVNLSKTELQSNALVEEIYTPALSQKSDKVKVQEANILKLKRSTDLRRILEANSDCV